MSVAHNKIIAKLQALDEYLGYLTELQKIEQRAFLKDYRIYGLAEHYLHLSIEALLDVSKLIIIAYGFTRPEEPRDTLRVLGERKVISEKLFDKLVGIGGFRNVLIHEYEKVDKALVFSYLHKNLGQFKEFKRQILRFLSRKK